MSDTPRTDAVSYDEDFFDNEVVSAEFARELERELAALYELVAKSLP